MQLSPRRIVATALAVGAAALCVVAPASADAAIPVHGQLAPTSATFYPKTVGSDLILGFTGTHAWTGSFTGTSTIVGYLVLHASGDADFRALITFKGSTPCGNRTVRFVAAGSGQLPFLSGRAISIDESVRANWQVDLVLDPATGAFVDYSGDVRCD